MSLLNEQSLQYLIKKIKNAIANTLKLGETASTAYRGDRGKIAYEHSQSSHAPINAEQNVQADWAVSTTASDAYIKNKPTSMPASDVPTWAKSSKKPTYTWDEVIDKPTSYTPTSHTHLKSQITDFPNIPTKTSQLTNDSGFKTTVYSHPSYTAKSSGLYKFAVDTTGHINAASAMTKNDIVSLGIPSQDTIYSLPTASSSVLGGVKTTSTVTSPTGLTACPIISGIPYYKDTNTTYSLSSFGINATATELNYTDGVTSNIQTQLNGKSSNTHTHDDRYFTETEVNNKLSGYSISNHNHSITNLTGTLTVAKGGTGSTTAIGSRSNLGASSHFTQTTEPTTQNSGDTWFRIY